MRGRSTSEGGGCRHTFLIEKKREEKRGEEKRGEERRGEDKRT